YPLPEAQLDRFMFLIRVGYPSADEETEIMKKVTSHYAGHPQVVLTGPEIQSLQDLVRRVPVPEHVYGYARDVVRASRPAEPECLEGLRDWIQWGAGPRASLYLILGAKARAILHGRFQATTADVDAVALPVLRHRILTTFQAEADGIKADDIIRKLLAGIRRRGGSALSHAAEA
ncbi:MAG: MoxR family ATPase, partial [Planctomycetes bacterium]|nr:MoxR family ATPase [Planctomycetota bacterium]